MTASDDLQGSYAHRGEERGHSEDKKVQEPSLTLKMLANTNTGTVDHALIKIQFSICALRPWAEFYLAVKRPNFVPVPIFIPAGFKRCFQTAYQNHRGGKSDARLLKEPSIAHHAKQGGNGPT